MSERASFINYLVLLEKKKKKKKKKKSCSGGGTRFGGYGLGWSGDSGSNGGGDGGMGESLIYELFGMRSGALPSATSANMLSIVRAQQQAEEEESTIVPEPEPFDKNTPESTIGGFSTKGQSKFDKAKSMIMSMVNQGYDREKIQAEFISRLGVTELTAETYYERLAREFDLYNRGGEKEDGEAAPDDDSMNIDVDPNQMDIPDAETFEIEGDPNKQGALRTVSGAHLVYKRRNEEGTFDELWSYNTDDKIQSEIEIKRDILSGTDIPSNSTRSKDRRQQTSLTTMGDGQLLHITGLPS